MSDRSSDKLESNDPGYGILGADLSVEGIKIPNIPAERWTPQDIISLHQVQLDTVKEKNRFFKWVIVTVVGGLLRAVQTTYGATLNTKNERKSRNRDFNTR